MNQQSYGAVDSKSWEFVSPVARQRDFEAWQRELEIFGDGDDLPSDEWALVFESKLPTEEMMARLRLLRANKLMKIRSFCGGLQGRGESTLRAFGIQLD